ncbi:MAG: hypothetical protein ACMXYD_05035 [Candidatus Woesearchaeota archaeon]
MAFPDPLYKTVIDVYAESFKEGIVMSNANLLAPVILPVEEQPTASFGELFLQWFTKIGVEGLATYTQKHTCASILGFLKQDDNTRIYTRAFCGEPINLESRLQEMKDFYEIPAIQSYSLLFAEKGNLYAVLNKPTLPREEDLLLYDPNQEMLV